MAVFLVWVSAVAVVLAIAADTKIGPILFTLSGRHGVHFGDALVLVAALLVAVCLTGWLLRRR